MSTVNPVVTQPMVAGLLAAPAPVTDPESGMIRDTPTVDPSRAALVKKWQGKILAAKKFHQPTFDRMRADMDFAGGKQWLDQVENDERYVANFVQRHVQQRTASLYAKNPRFFYKRKRKLDFKIWDGRQITLQSALQSITEAQQRMVMAQTAVANGAVVDPEAAQMQIQAGMAMVKPAMDLVKDVSDGQQRQQMLDRIGKTLELLAEHEVAEQKPPFKKQMKQLIRRTLTCAVGYVKLGFERQTERRPEDAEKVRDYTQRIAVLDRLIADAKDGQDCSCETAEMDELKLMLQDAQTTDEQIIREGLVFDFCPSTSIIIDPACRQLQGFIGARWIAQEFQLTVNDVKETYGIDLASTGHTAYSDSDSRKTDFSGMNSTSGANSGDERPNEGKLCAVWQVQDKETGKVFTLVDGYPDFLEEPKAPEVQLERFWTIFALTLNDLENDRKIFPPSDVELQRHQQLEWNRSREGLREHRIAARPAMVSTVALSDEDKVKLETHPANAILELEAADGKKAEDILQAIKKPGIDPNLYITDHLAADRQLVTGVQDTGLGAVNGDTATANSIAEGSRQTSVGSNVDDLDDFLAELGHAMGHVLLQNMSTDTVTKVVGPGAVWPELSAQEVSEDLYLDVEAGSSGRPNRAAEIANAKEVVPLLLQVPGIDPKWIAKLLIQRLDDKMDIEEGLLEGMPPISALARTMMTPMGGGAPAQGDPAADPAQQGGQGANNAPKPPGSEIPGAQTDPMAGVREPFKSHMQDPRNATA